MQINTTLLQRMRDATGQSIQEVAVEAKLCHQTVWRAMNGRYIAEDTRTTIYNALRSALQKKFDETRHLLEVA